MGISLRCPISARHVPILLVITLAIPPQSAKGEERFTVAQIFIVGNTETPQHFIHEVLRLYPGQKASLDCLQLAEERLHRVRVWGRATVTVVPEPENAERSDFRDILVTIDEQKWNWLLFGVSYELLVFRATGDLDRFGYAAQRVNNKLREWVSGR